MEIPKRGNRACAPVVTKATTRSPGVSENARTTQGRRLDADRSVNGKRARTMSPGLYIPYEIRIAVSGLDISIGIKIRFVGEKIERPT
jgi:hypothetical protein